MHFTQFACWSITNTLSFECHLIYIQHITKTRAATWRHLNLWYIKNKEVLDKNYGSILKSLLHSSSLNHVSKTLEISLLNRNAYKFSRWSTEWTRNTSLLSTNWICQSNITVELKASEEHQSPLVIQAKKTQWVKNRLMFRVTLKRKTNCELFCEHYNILHITKLRSCNQYCQSNRTYTLAFLAWHMRFSIEKLFK